VGVAAALVSIWNEYFDVTLTRTPAANMRDLAA